MNHSTSFLASLSLVLVLQASAGEKFTALGWSAMPNTKLRSVCPADNFQGSGYDFTSKCDAVTTAWNSGALDETRNRLLVWGGGHADYSGNEIYALDLTTQKFVRLTDPATPVATGCPESLAAGTQPNARHTYDGIAYMTNVDRFLVAGGALATCGFMSEGTWTFDFKSSKWAQVSSAVHPNAAPGIVTAYDANTGKVWVHDGNTFFSFDPLTNKYQVALDNTPIDYHLTGVLDPKRKKFLMIGGGEQWIIDVSGTSFKQQALGSTGGSSIIGASSPGLAYDKVKDRIVAWSGGNTVYVLDMDTKVWTAVTHPSGPGAAMSNGTNGRWEYVPALNAFVIVNGVDSDAFLLRLNLDISAIGPRFDLRHSQRGYVLAYPGSTDGFASWDLEGKAIPYHWVRTMNISVSGTARAR